MAKESDKFKELIDLNRPNLDIRTFDEDAAWEFIERKLTPRYSVRRQIANALLRAAAVLLLFGAVSLGYLTWNKYHQYRSGGIGLTQLSQDLRATEIYYTDLIQERVVNIRELNPELAAGVLHELDAIDREYLQLKKDITDRADNEEVINAMIAHYRFKLNLLESILEDVQRKKVENDEIHSL
jgi:hypothetical protein